jgi:hypothetical protein
MSDSEVSDVEEQAEVPKKTLPPRNPNGRDPRATQSLRQMPVTTPPRVLKKSKSAPQRQIQNSSMYMAQSPPSGYSSPGVAMPQPVAYPQYAAPYVVPNAYYPPPVQPTVIIRQSHAQVPYNNYDPNFEAYFGPDVRRSQTSTLAMQREQLENYERRRPHNSYSSERRTVSSFFGLKLAFVRL